MRDYHGKATKILREPSAEVPCPAYASIIHYRYGGDPLGIESHASKELRIIDDTVDRNSYESLEKMIVCVS